VSFNRSIVELKGTGRLTLGFGMYSFNRSIVELKGREIWPCL